MTGTREVLQVNKTARGNTATAATAQATSPSMPARYVPPADPTSPKAARPPHRIRRSWTGLTRWRWRTWCGPRSCREQTGPEQGDREMHSFRSVFASLVSDRVPCPAHAACAPSLAAPCLFPCMSHAVTTHPASRPPNSAHLRAVCGHTFNIIAPAPAGHAGSRRHVGNRLGACEVANMPVDSTKTEAARAHMLFQPVFQF